MGQGEARSAPTVGGGSAQARDVRRLGEGKEVGGEQGGQEGVEEEEEDEEEERKEDKGREEGEADGFVVVAKDSPEVRRVRWCTDFASFCVGVCVCFCFVGFAVNIRPRARR